MTTEKMEVDSAMPEWQKEYAPLKRLPYYSKIITEADEQLAVIKAGLGHSILLREVRPALLHWACELDKYIYLHGRRFTKEDHVAFVKIFYELVLMPDLELRMVKTFARLLTILLQKRELLSRNDICLDWRPLYTLYCHIAYKNLEEDGLLLMPTDMAQSIESLVRVSRVYFPASATQEILDELRPYMCPWDKVFSRAAQCYCLFLPTALPPVHHGSGFKLWFEEVLFWWINIHCGPPWESQYVALLARTARENIGYIDWNPYLPDIFTRLLRSLHLVIGKGDSGVEVGNGRGFDADSAATWLASMLGGPSKTQEFMDRFFAALESYYHPSNYGIWTDRLFNFLSKLPLAVCQRVNRERYRKPDWQTPIPEEYQLTDDDIKKFVRSLLPCATTGLFSKRKAEIAAYSVQLLSHLCPEVVLPEVLELIYPALQTLTEPHRLMQTLNALIVVCLPLVRTPQFQEHVISLMNQLLPGLDANDVSKSMLTFQTLSLFAAMVPLVDCSDAVHLRDDLTTTEKELCSATATLEDFVNQLMDKILFIVENCAYGNAIMGRRKSIDQKFSPEESLLKSGMYACLRSVMANCSSAIYKIAFERLFAFVAGTVLEGRITAEMVGELCFSAVRTNPGVALARFMPLISGKLHELVTPELYEELEISEAVLWYLIMATQICRCDGRVLIHYKAEWLDIVARVLPLKSKEAYDVVASLIEHLLGALTGIYTADYAHIRRQLDQSLETYLPVRHWAEPCDQKTMKIEWHVPNAEEVAMAHDILNLALLPQLEKLEKPETLSKEDVLKCLTLIRGTIAGASALMPLFDGPVLTLVESAVDMHPFQYTIDDSGLTLDCRGKNLRDVILTVMHKLVTFMLRKREDDTKSLAAVCKIFSLLANHRGVYKHKFEQQAKGFAVAKRIMIDKVRGKKSFIRPLLVEMSYMQHHKRMLETGGYYFTDCHLMMIRDLLLLATSHYSQVRKEAQAMLDHCFIHYPYAYKKTLPDLLSMLKEDTDVTHEQFKGALYVLLSNKKKSLCTRNDWNVLNQIWPAVIRAQHGEKPSIIALLDTIHNSVVDNLESFQITFEFPTNALEAAELLWINHKQPNIAPAWPKPDAHALNAAQVAEKQRNVKMQESYITLARTLTQLSENTTLHWRHLDMAQSFLALLIRMDQRLPPESVRLLCKLLLNDAMKTRKMAVGAIGALLRIIKPIAAKTVYYPDALAGGGESPAVPSSALTTWPITFGFRKDNEWLQYADSKVDRNREAYDNCTFIEKTHWGFYVWPRKLTIKAPPAAQVWQDRSMEHFAPDERAAYDFFADAANVKKLCELMCVEEKKGEDEFHTTNFALFKFQAKIAALAKSTHENEQRLAAEFLSGVLQGSKLWMYDKREALFDWVLPLFKEAFQSITTETMRDWGTCIATVFDSRDPRKLTRLIDLLVETAHKPIDSTFNCNTRFYLLQGGINQLEWRVIEVWRKLLAICVPLMPQSYQNIRERLGSCLSTVFWYDITGMVNETVDLPSRARFLSQMNDKLKVLWAEAEGETPDQVLNGHKSPTQTPQRKEAILVLKTLLMYFNAHAHIAYKSAVPEVLAFAPLLCYFENETSDDELKRDCHTQLLLMSNMLLSRDVVALVLQLCQKACKFHFWKARVSALRYLRVAVFSNLFMFDTAAIKHDVMTIITSLLKDPQIEVQQAASETLSGFLHCEFFNVDKTLTSSFRKWTQLGDLAQKHGGVLGLAAIVQSCPYSVPDFLPEVLMTLSTHANDPQPVQGTVKKTLQEFKRTHLDSWHEHKKQFSDDQLAVLTDLLVSPSYYV